MSQRPFRDQDYAQLLSLRTALRRFERWSTFEAESHGLTTAQHQLLLAVRGHPDRRGPTVGEVAEYLLVRHHSAVELVNRTERAGLVRREPDTEDGRVVRIRLTEYGETTLASLTATHVEELVRLKPLISSLSEAQRRGMN